MCMCVCVCVRVCVQVCGFLIDPETGSGKTGQKFLLVCEALLINALMLV